MRQDGQVRGLEVATRLLVPKRTELVGNGAAAAAFSNRSHIAIESLHRVTGNHHTRLWIAAEDFGRACKGDVTFGLIMQTDKGSVRDPGSRFACALPAGQWSAQNSEPGIVIELSGFRHGIRSQPARRAVRTHDQRVLGLVLAPGLALPKLGTATAPKVMRCRYRSEPVLSAS